MPEELRLGTEGEQSLEESGVSTNISEDDISENEREIHENTDDNDYCTRFLLSNARSLSPKITSFIDYIYELKCDFAMVTETWFRGGRQLNEELADIESASGIKLICKNRPVRGRGVVGGGVAIAINTARSNLKKKVVKTVHEIVCVVGKIASIERQFAIFAVYIPPSIKAGGFATLCEDLAAALGEVRVSLKNPVIIVGGDFNNRDPAAAFEALEGFEKLRSGPTRGNATLDVIYTNAGEHLLGDTASTYPPLESEGGLASDHLTVWAGLKFGKKRDFEWTRVSVRLRSEQREAAFERDLANVEWDFLLPLDTDQAVAGFEKKISELTDTHFPLTSFRRRTNEKPWITNAIRKKSKRKRRIFRKRGRSEKWRAISAELEREVRQSKEAFVDGVTEGGGNGKDFYSAVKKLSGPGGGSSWSVKKLFPGANDEQVCNEVLDYFSSVGGRERGERIDVPGGVHSGLKFTPDQVLKCLKDLKKKNSHVEGDPLPDLVRKMPGLFVEPVTTIFNKAGEAARWPKRWKTEYITVIPKVKNPSSLTETRNISCTALLSKVLEGALLEQLRDELVPDPDQYGGIKACGAEHMLINVWDAALDAMDAGGDAVVLLGVDFQKAFNRMEYAACLNQLRDLGASPGSLAMVHSFLEGRTMKMKLGSYSSKAVEILRGSPQGSVMGCALYCATTQSLQLPPPRGPDPTHGSPRTLTGIDVPRGDMGPTIPRARQPSQPVRFFDYGPESDESDSDVQFWMTGSPASGEEYEGGDDLEDDRPRERSLGTVKYIDDTTLIQAVPLEGAAKHFTTAATVESLEPGGLGERFAGLVTNARDIGMEINCSKTQLLCMSPNNGCVTVARIHTPEGPVDSVSTLKLVGFVFGSDPNASAHIDHLVEKFRIKVWLLYHLREAGIREDRLFKLYCVYIRSILEYCSPVYHSLLTAGQAETLERLQRHAARICYGNDEIREVMRQKGIATLESRRMERVDRFIQKAVSDVRFGPLWFPKRHDDGHGLRERRAFYEKPTKTARAFNNPRSYFVRRANQLGLDWNF